MIQTEFNSETVFLINDEPDWTTPAEAEFTLARDQQSSLTHRQGRRPYSGKLLTRINYSSTVRGAKLRELQTQLRALNTQTVICPLFPAVQYWADRASAPIDGGLRIVWKADWSQFEIYTDVEPVWPDDSDLFAPALQGFLNLSNSPVLTTTAFPWQVDFVESSPADYALEPAAIVWTAGPQPAGYGAAPKLMPFRPDCRGVSESISMEVDRQHHGFTRNQGATFYQHGAERAQEATYTLPDEITTGKFLRFFLDLAAPGSSFWAASTLELAQLTADAAAVDTVLNVVDTEGLNVGDYVSIYVGLTPVARKVTAKSSNTITLNAAAGVVLPAARTRLYVLCLARLDKAAIKLTWQRPGSAVGKVSWTELPAEYVIPVDETLGTTIGRLPTRVVLFEFSHDYGNGTVVVDRFTNYEEDVTYGGNDYISADIDHGDISTALNFDNSGVLIDMFNFSGNPLLKYVALRAESRLQLQIIHADLAAGVVSNAVVVFLGDLDEPSRSGNRFSAAFKFGVASLEDQFPREVRGPLCNRVTGPNPDGSFLISFGCTLLKADWKFTANVANPISSAFPYALNLDTLTGIGADAIAALAAGAVFADWFAFGWLEIGAGANIQRRAILKSTVPVAGALTLKLQRWFDVAPVAGGTVSLFPGCPGTVEACKAFDEDDNPGGKFDNYLNFGGHPFIPAGNPSLQKLTKHPPAGAKK